MSYEIKVTQVGSCKNDENVWETRYNAPIYPIPIPLAPSNNWFQDKWQNKPQSRSVTCAALLFISAGMNIAWSSGFYYFSNHYGFTTQMKISWYIGVIIGAILGSIVVNFLNKKFIMLFSAIMVVISGILIVSVIHSYGAILAARYINGIGIGNAFVASFVMIGEESKSIFRGMVASSVESLSCSIGIYLQTIFIAVWPFDLSDPSTFDVGQFLGVLHILFGFIAFTSGLSFIVESPVYYLVRGEEQLAIDSLRRLQRPFVVTVQTYELLEQHKKYIEINKEMTRDQSAIQGVSALWKLCYYRALIAMSFSVFTTFSFKVSVIFAVDTIVWPYILYGTLRWLGSLFSCLCMDVVGRKRIIAFGLPICGALSIALGSLFDDDWNIDTSTYMIAILTILLIYQFFAGIHTTPSSAYLSEAFPLGVKNFYIAIPYIVEMIVYIIIGAVDLTIIGLSTYFYALGGLTLVFFVISIFMLPETKRTTLLESQELFKTCLCARGSRM